MALKPKRRQDVALPYRRGFITDFSIQSVVADALNEFDKLEVATDELIDRINSLGKPALDAILQRLTSLEQRVTALESKK